MIDKREKLAVCCLLCKDQPSAIIQLYDSTLEAGMGGTHVTFRLKDAPASYTGILDHPWPEKVLHVAPQICDNEEDARTSC